MEYMSLTHSPGLSLFDFSASWHAPMTSSAWGFMASAQSLQMSFKAMDAQRARSGSLRADVTIGATMGRRVECMASHSAKPPMQSRAEEMTRILLLYGSIGSLARNWVSTGHSSSSSASDSAGQKRSLFVFWIDSPKQNAGSLLTLVPHTVFYALSHGALGFSPHGSFNNH